MQRQQVNFLDARRAVVGHRNVHIGVGEQLDQAPARAAGERHHGHVLRVRRFDGGQHVGRVAAGADGDQHVAGLADGLHLLGVDRGKVVVVADRREDGAVGGQRDGRQTRALALEATHQFGGEMLGVGGRAAIAAGQYLAAGRDAAQYRLDRLGDRLAHGLGSGVFEVGAVKKLLLDALFKHGQAS